ncbi:toll-like receptor Tollo [Leptopilina heterotoma]|uniref:toll-like receptor Tollo n=1 Tax=Leptopilina heterotoma TaxID=63436 RepID=UPI001CAA00D2|nr:toll-like receptor Tollo [Leptopilina heterotoma]
MLGSPAFFAILLGTIFGVLGASLSKALRYKAPDECEWVATGDSVDDVSLVCRLRTINSELENTNFSVIQPQHTVRLKLICSDALFYQSSLSAGSFRPLIELRDLIIEYCKIGNLSDEAFKGLKELRNLTVRTHNTDWSSMSLEISSRAFTEDLQKLEKLDLSENNMWSLPDGLLCPLRSLEVLNLAKNRLRDVEGFQFGYRGRCAMNLKCLNLSNNSIESLPSATFAGLSRLQNLDLSGNSIVSMADRTFEGLTSLTVITLANNRLTSLPPELFSDSRDVNKIYLRNNTLSVLPPGLFGELTQLVVLDLSRNELTSEWVNAATFGGLVRLVDLDLSCNRIARLEPAVFRDMYSLQILRLQENLIENLVDNTFASLSNLHTLVLSDNRLTEIDGSTLSGLYVLSLLSLDNNRLASLSTNSFRNASSLQDLHLNGNRLTEVPDALKATPSLRTLDLGENLIYEIPDGTFDHVSQLYGLRLTENHIGNLSKGIFDKIKELKILNLSRNRIQFIEPGSFDNNLNLQAIRLDGNQLTEIGGLFTSLPNLVWLNVSDNMLKRFDYSMIPSGLQWLDIHSNEISVLENNLDIETQLHLSTFDASENKLTEITTKTIPMSIETLLLNDNLITQVMSYSFLKKPNLTRVNLKGNRISKLDPYSFRLTNVPYDKQIPEFYIGDNDYLCDCSMEWLQEVNNNQSENRNQPQVMDLESIYCKLLYDREHQYVPLVEASHSQFLCKYEDHCLVLCHCCDFDACDCEMTCPANCTCYHDQSWSANVVDCSRAGHTGKLPEQIPMDATRLYLDGNDLRVISSHAFIGRKKLKVLFLNNSNIEIVQNRSFNGLRELEDLHLQDNGIRELRGHEFEGLESLKILHLENNRLTMIGNGTFVSLVSLRILRLNGNRLMKLSVWSLPTSIEVTLAGNLWSCDCDYLKDFRKWIQSPKVIVTDVKELECFTNTTQDIDDDNNPIEDNGIELSLLTTSYSANGTICSSLENVENSSVYGNFAKKTSFSDQDYLPLLVSTLVAFLILVITCILAFIYRHELRVWFHSRFGVRIFYRHADVDRDDRDKLFDAFVSYSSKDEAFVAEELAPVLETGNPSYKLCLHYRDFPVGNFIADTIVQGVESSRRTIMVLSENFIKSEWCRFDFKSAHHQVLRDRRRRLILVLVGEVPQRDLDPDIRLYLKTNTYLQWGDKLFWEKLRFALPDVPNNQRTTPRRQPPPVRRQHNNQMSNGSRTLAVHI